MQRELSNDSSIDVRLKALKEMGKVVTENRLEQVKYFFLYCVVFV